MEKEHNTTRPNSHFSKKKWLPQVGLRPMTLTYVRRYLIVYVVTSEMYTMYIVTFPEAGCESEVVWVASAVVSTLSVEGVATGVSGPTNGIKHTHVLVLYMYIQRIALCLHTCTRTMFSWWTQPRCLCGRKWYMHANTKQPKSQAPQWPSGRGVHAQFHPIINACTWVRNWFSLHGLYSIPFHFLRLGVKIVQLQTQGVRKLPVSLSSSTSKITRGFSR